MAKPSRPHLLLLLALVLPSSPSPSTAGKCNKNDKIALLSIKAAFPGTHLSSWDNTTACCDWFGVDCNLESRVYGLKIFSHPTLSGSIPSAVGDLPFLNEILIHNLPGLVGSIPPSIARLTRLSLLDLNRNSLSGPIPAFLAQIPSLTFIDLSFNKFQGSIPPELPSLPHLDGLHLEYNQLTGSIPASFSHFKKSSSPSLFLSHNNFSGEIPSELGGIAWETVDLSQNRLTGDPSFLFGRAKGTGTIDLSQNLFVFDLTRVSFPVHLSLLYLNHNQITGSIPAQINAVANLFSFNVSYNRLCGPIPAGPITAKFGPNAYSHNKCLCGSPLPAC